MAADPAGLSAKKTSSRAVCSVGRLANELDSSAPLGELAAGHLKLVYSGRRTQLHAQYCCDESKGRRWQDNLQR